MRIMLVILLISPTLFSACKQTEDRALTLSIEEIREKYGKSANAYELHTTGMGLGRAEIFPVSPVVVNSKLDRVLITYHPSKEGIAPGGRVSVCIPPGSTLPQLQHEDSAGYVGITTSDGLPVNGDIIRVGLHRRSEAPGNKEPYRMLARNYRVVVAELPEGLQHKGIEIK